MLRLVTRFAPKGVIAAPAALSTSSASYATPTFDYRRLKRRSQWRAAESEDPDSIVISTEPSLGSDADLNWAINKYKVTPKKEAFRNLHLRGYQMFVNSKDGQGRAVIPAGAEDHTTYVVDDNATGPAVLTTAEATAKAREVRRFLSSQPQLFVQDGAIGSLQSSVLARTISNCASIGLAFSIMLQNATLGNPFAFEDEFVTIVARVPEAQSSFTMLNPAERWAMVSGAPSVASVMDAAAAMANHVLASETDLVPLAHSHVLKTAKGTGLLFGYPNAVVCPELFSAQNNAWASSGLIRSFNGVVTSDLSGGYTPKKGDVLENGASGSCVTTAHGGDVAASTGHPTGVAFLVKDSKAPALASLDAKAAAKHFEPLSASLVPGVDAKALTDKFVALVEANGVKLFAVNATKPAKEVSKNIIAATNGGK